MNERMNFEIERTIERLRPSMPKKRNVPPPTLRLVKIALCEMNPVLLTGAFLGVLLSGYLFARYTTLPVHAVFCITPLPMMLMLHCCVLNGNEALRELESTLRYSYAEMLSAKFLVISVYTALSLTCLSLTVCIVSATAFVRLLLYGALPAVYLYAAILFASAKVREAESISAVAAALWVAFMILLTELRLVELIMKVSAGSLCAGVAAGIILCCISTYKHLRREKYATYSK